VKTVRSDPTGGPAPSGPRPIMTALLVALGCDEMTQSLLVDVECQACSYLLSRVTAWASSPVGARVLGTGSIQNVVRPVAAKDHRPNDISHAALALSTFIEAPRPGLSLGGRVLHQTGGRSARAAHDSWPVRWPATGRVHRTHGPQPGHRWSPSEEGGLPR